QHVPRDYAIQAASSDDHDHLVEVARVALREAGWDLDTVARPVERRDPAAGLIERGAPLAVVERALEQVNLYLGVAGLAAADPRRPVLTVLNSVLGGGMSSRLFQEVREQRGLAYSVDSFATGVSGA